MQFGHLLFLWISVKSIFGAIHVDLTHSIKSTDPIFPGLIPFNFTQTVASWKRDDLNESYFVALNTFLTSEHFGTHIDAPYHGSNTSWTVEQIPLERLVSIKGLTVDVSKKSSRVQNYHIQIEDLNEGVMNEANGYFVLLIYTGKSKFWPNQEAYAGGDRKDKLDFPGLSPQLASHLVTKYAGKLVGVGIDTLSSKSSQKKFSFDCDIHSILVDPGSSKYFHAHRTLFKENIYALENVAALDLLLKHLSKRAETFFQLDVLPMKIEGGTGGPCRLVAHLEDADNSSGGWFGFLIFCLLVAVIGIAAKAIYDIKFNPNKTFA